MTSKRPCQAKDYRLEQMDSEILLYHPVKTKTFYLNETASLIWRLCDGHRTSAEIAELLKGAFPDGEATIADEVESTLDELATQGVVEFVDP